MNPSDEELDRNWKPNGRRPQSTIARSFSQELMDIFRIENSVNDMDEKIDKRKQEVSTQASELEALEQRIREMEERLKRSQPGASTAGQQSSPRAPRQALGDTFAARGDAPVASTEKELPARPAQASRPGTAKQQTQQAPVRGGAMPPTPTASEDGDDDS